MQLRRLVPGSKSSGSGRATSLKMRLSGLGSPACRLSGMLVVFGTWVSMSMAVLVLSSEVDSQTKCAVCEEIATTGSGIGEPASKTPNPNLGPKDG